MVGVRHEPAVAERGGLGAPHVLLERAPHGALVGARVAARHATGRLLPEVVREGLVTTPIRRVNVNN